MNSFYQNGHILGILFLLSKKQNKTNTKKKNNQKKKPKQKNPKNPIKPIVNRLRNNKLKAILKYLLLLRVFSSKISAEFVVYFLFKSTMSQNSSRMSDGRKKKCFINRFITRTIWVNLCNRHSVRLCKNLSKLRHA